MATGPPKIFLQLQIIYIGQESNERIPEIVPIRVAPSRGPQAHSHTQQKEKPGTLKESGCNVIIQ